MITDNSACNQCPPDCHLQTTEIATKTVTIAQLFKSANKGRLNSSGPPQLAKIGGKTSDKNSNRQIRLVRVFWASPTKHCRQCQQHNFLASRVNYVFSSNSVILSHPLLFLLSRLMKLLWKYGLTKILAQCRISEFGRSTLSRYERFCLRSHWMAVCRDWCSAGLILHKHLLGQSLHAVCAKLLFRGSSANAEPWEQYG